MLSEVGQETVKTRWHSGSLAQINQTGGGREGRARAGRQQCSDHHYYYYYCNTSNIQTPDTALETITKTASPSLSLFLYNLFLFSSPVLSFSVTTRVSLLSLATLNISQLSITSPHPFSTSCSDQAAFGRK